VCVSDWLIYRFDRFIAVIVIESFFLVRACCLRVAVRWVVTDWWRTFQLQSLFLRVRFVNFSWLWAWPRCLRSCNSLKIFCSFAWLVPRWVRVNLFLLTIFVIRDSLYFLSGILASISLYFWHQMRRRFLFLVAIIFGWIFWWRVLVSKLWFTSIRKMMLVSFRLMLLGSCGIVNGRSLVYIVNSDLI